MSPSLPANKLIEITIKIKPEFERLDQFLVGAFPGYSRSLIRRAIEDGGVSVNGLDAKPSQKVRPGDQVRFWLPQSNTIVPTPEDIPLSILYEDEYLAVIDKPPGMVVHPAKGNWGGTLVNALSYHFEKLSQINGEYRPGIVHRLDRDTTGAILVAKDEVVHQKLSQQFERRTVFKEYVAITQGVLDRDSDYIERPIGHHRHDRVKMTTYDAPDENKGIRDACTYYEVIERFLGYTYCRLHPKTGRTHQLRVHLAYVGCPVLADKNYSGRDSLKLADLLPRDEAQSNPYADDVLMARQALHAHQLRFQHPKDGRWIDIVAPLPDDFVRTLERLREYRTV